MVAVTSNSAVVTLPSDTQILITREFDAPKHLVFKAWTTPELIKRWWSGDHGEVIIAEVDLRVGGTWRYVMTANEGFEVAFHGEFHEILPNERIVSTEVFEGMPDAHAVDTITFTEQDGRTTLRPGHRQGRKGDAPRLFPAAPRSGDRKRRPHAELRRTARNRESAYLRDERSWLAPPALDRRERSARHDPHFESDRRAGRD